MALRYWKRMREQGAAGADDPRPAGENPWQQDRPAPTLSQLGSVYDLQGDDRADRYRDWAARIRDRKAPEPQSEPRPASTAGYWSADALFADSRRVEREESRDTPNPWRVRDLLALFDLRDGATTAEIGSAYRRLAKQHHPDRYVQADAGTQEFHAGEMRRIIDAYQELRELERV